MRSLSKIFFISATLFSTFSYADGLADVHYGYGKVKELIVFNTNIVTFKLENYNNRAACASQESAWAIKLDTDFGKASYSMLLAAKSAETEIKVWGNNSCGIFTPNEDAAMIFVQD